MTARPIRAELRHSILARLSSFTEEVEWVGTGAHLAFADSIIEFADWLANTSDPPPLHGTTSTREARRQALEAAAAAVTASREKRKKPKGAEE